MAREGPPPDAPTDLEPDDEADTAFDFPRHSWLTHDQLPPMPAAVAKVPRSVFDLATIDARPVALLKTPELPPTADRVNPQRYAGPLGALRVNGCRYPSNRWTDERVECERIRRAKQRPPKPTKLVKTRSKKLRDLIGNQFDDLD
jgi:hypothetical protein